MSATRNWRLSTRVTRTFALTTALLVLTIAALSALFLKSSVEREIGGLLGEELDELSLGFPATSGSLEDFAELVQRLQQDHSANPMAFRIWTPAGELWAELGAPGLLSDKLPVPPPGPVRRADKGLRWRVTGLPTGHLVGIVVDGSEQFRLLRQFVALSLVLALVAGGLAFVGGALFVRRACGLLRQVAEQARAVRMASDAGSIGVPGAPEEIRAVSEALSAMLANIRAEAERARLLTTGLAHELGSPIQNLIGEAQVTLMAERSVEEHRALLESQLEELRDLARTVGNLVALCSLGEERRAAELEQFDLGEEARLRLVRERAKARRRAVELALETRGDLHLCGDREALMLALSNLVSNAIDWSPEGGRVVAALEGGPQGVEVTVDDAGPGVPLPERERVFEPFYRGPAAQGRRLGYGLGLSIARAAVEAHGGTIEISTSPAGGARLRISLARVGRSRDSPGA